MLKILFLASNPHESSRLKLDKELRGILEKIRLSTHRDHIKLIPVLAVQKNDFLDALNEHNPDVIHFSGHGKASGELVLDSENGMPESLSPSMFSKLLQVVSPCIKLVVLNACFSMKQAKDISKFVDSVIGVNGPIPDSQAIDFAKGFYSSIGFGKTLKESFEQGNLSLEMIKDNNRSMDLGSRAAEERFLLVLKKGISPDFYLLNIDGEGSDEKKGDHFLIYLFSFMLLVSFVIFYFFFLFFGF